MIFKINLLAVLLLIPAFLFAQWGKGISVEPTLHVGKILKHTSDLRFPVERISTGFEINFTSKKYGRKSWQQQLKYPKGGVSLFYYHLGDQQLFGQAIGLVPNFIFPIFQKKKWSGNFQLGWGIAYVSKRFDPIDNPLNNALGSNINSLNTFRWQINYQVNPKWKFNLGTSFTHFSNGASQLPNFGLNVPALFVGTVFTPRPIKKEDIISHAVEPIKKRWGLSMHFDLAYRESSNPGGPRYPFYVASLAGVRRLSAVQEISFGVDYEYNKAIYIFELHTSGFNSEAEARRGATRLGVFVADEFLLGNVGLYGQIGTYIPGYNFRTSWFLYTKVAMRYYLPAVGKPATRFYLGLYLKSHKAVAEYLAVGIGARL